MVRVAIFDYGAGNIFSLKNSLERADATVDVISSLDKTKAYSGILFPGVGNFDPAIKSIKNYSATEFAESAASTVPVLGICLGMEMFFEKSQEGKERGLGMMQGEVVVLPNDLKVPHMGWNSLDMRRDSKIMEGVPDKSWVYFVHSFRAKPASEDIIVADSDYGVRIPAIVQQDNLIGVQFHPEKSGDVGATMIRNFLDVCKK